MTTREGPVGNSRQLTHSEALSTELFPHKRALAVERRSRNKLMRDILSKYQTGRLLMHRDGRLTTSNDLRERRRQLFETYTFDLSPPAPSRKKSRSSPSKSRRPTSASSNSPSSAALRRHSSSPAATSPHDRTHRPISFHGTPHARPRQKSRPLSMSLTSSSDRHLLWSFSPAAHSSFLRRKAYHEKTRIHNRESEVAFRYKQKLIRERIRSSRGALGKAVRAKVMGREATNYHEYMSALQREQDEGLKQRTQNFLRSGTRNEKFVGLSKKKPKKLKKIRRRQRLRSTSGGGGGDASPFGERRRSAALSKISSVIKSTVPDYSEVFSEEAHAKRLRAMKKRQKAKARRKAAKRRRKREEAGVRQQRWEETLELGRKALELKAKKQKKKGRKRRSGIGIRRSRRNRKAKSGNRWMEEPEPQTQPQPQPTKKPPVPNQRDILRTQREQRMRVMEKKGRTTTTTKSTRKNTTNRRQKTNRGGRSKRQRQPRKAAPKEPQLHAPLVTAGPPHLLRQDSFEVRAAEAAEAARKYLDEVDSSYSDVLRTKAQLAEEEMELDAIVKDASEFDVDLVDDDDEDGQPRVDDVIDLVEDDIDIDHDDEDSSSRASRVGAAILGVSPIHVARTSADLNVDLVDETVDLAEEDAEDDDDEIQKVQTITAPSVIVSVSSPASSAPSPTETEAAIRTRERGPGLTTPSWALPPYPESPDGKSPASSSDEGKGESPPHAAVHAGTKTEAPKEAPEQEDEVATSSDYGFDDDLAKEVDILLRESGVLLPKISTPTTTTTTTPSSSKTSSSDLNVDDSMRGLGGVVSHVPGTEQQEQPQQRRKQFVDDELDPDDDDDGGLGQQQHRVPRGEKSLDLGQYERRDGPAGSSSRRQQHGVGDDDDVMVKALMEETGGGGGGVNSVAEESEGEYYDDEEEEGEWVDGEEEEEEGEWIDAEEEEEEEEGEGEWYYDEEEEGEWTDEEGEGEAEAG